MFVCIYNFFSLDNFSYILLKVLLSLIYVCVSRGAESVTLIKSIIVNQARALKWWIADYVQDDFVQLSSGFPHPSDPWKVFPISALAMDDVLNVHTMFHRV